MNKLAKVPSHKVLILCVCIYVFMANKELKFTHDWQRAGCYGSLQEGKLTFLQLMGSLLRTEGWLGFK